MSNSRSNFSSRPAIFKRLLALTALLLTTGALQAERYSYGVLACDEPLTAFAHAKTLLTQWQVLETINDTCQQRMAEVEAVWEKLRAGANANADQLANADVVKVFKIYARLDAQDHIPPLRLAQHFLINAKWTLAKDNAEFVIARLQRPGPLSEIEAEHLGEAGSIFHEARVHLAEQDQYAEISVKRSANGCHNLRSTATLAYQQEPVHFKLDSAQLDGIGEKAVAQLARDLIDCPLTNPMLVGHTDPNAAAAYNCDLAKRRVETVREKLLVLGVPGAASIQLLWLGEAVPYSPSSAQKTRLQALNESARQSEHYSLDRRVELISREWSTATAALCGAKMKERKP